MNNPQMTQISTQERLKRLEEAVTTLASWLMVELGQENTKTIIGIVHPDLRESAQSADEKGAA